MQACDATARINDAQKLTQPNSEKRKAILDCLPTMFDTIHLICQSTDCSLITKQQLVHKIISNNLDIEETSEVEELLGLLEELVPGWMCKKSTCNGEFLYCIKRLPDPDSVRTRLSEAV
ncbi:CDT1-like protein a, chloroplastic [Phalaenopsis equestris]|uniref:CDT1-like protein a, chloroplastic n=1 Tax=Phalaenopsis equestris TaxID=78828 RepID=UPI0009E27CE4|nr:CDT1-like protein a, chloroplastic [Phalaenopsis equestris]XP_020597744.1 CDT1-like protein a, chloroplastic [Phalaenopsis equestris]